MHSGSPSRASAMEEWLSCETSTTVMAPEPTAWITFSGEMKAAVSSSRPKPTAKGLKLSALNRRPRRSRSRKCWSIRKRLVSPKPGAKDTMPAFGVPPMPP